MKRKIKEIGKKATAIGLSLAMAGSSFLSGTITANAADYHVRFDSDQFLTQAMTHLGDGYSQENRMAPGITDCTSFIYKTLRECGFDGGSGIYADDNTIPASTNVWIERMIRNELVIKDTSGNYAEIVYANNYAEYNAMKDDTANYGGKLIVCKQAVDTATLSSADLPAGTIVITEAYPNSPAHAQIVIGKPGTNGLPKNFTSTGGNDYYTKLTAYMNDFFASLEDMYGLTESQMKKMVVIPADVGVAGITAISNQNALSNSWKYANWGYFNEASFATRNENAISCLIDGNGISLNDYNWVIDSASTTYGTRLRMGITGKGGTVVNAYLVTPVWKPETASFTVTKQGLAVSNGAIKSVTFQIKANGSANVKDADGKPLSTTSTTINFNYGKTAKSYTWDNLLKYNSNGTEIKYSAVETKVVYKDSSGTERTVTQTSNPSISDIFGPTTSYTNEGSTEIVNNAFNTLYGRFAIKKVDDENNPVGATFYVYSDQACTSYLGKFTCNSTTGLGNYSSTTWSAREGMNKTVYFKEYDSNNDGYITVNNKTYKVDSKVHKVVMNGVLEPAKLSNATWTIDGASGTKTIENNEQISHTVKKTLSGDATSYVTGITVQLYRNVNGGTASKVGSEIAISANDSWSYTWKNLPKCDNSNRAYHYYAVETSVSFKTPDGSTGKLNTESDMNLYFTRSTDNGANTTTIKNTTKLTNALSRLYGAVQIEKVDSENNTVKIAGVEYGVFEDQACTNQICNIKTDTNGIATYTVSGNWYRLDSETKTVYVKEMKTVSPYILDQTVYSVVITGSEIDAVHSSVSVTSPEGVIVSNNGDHTRISVYTQDNQEKYGQIVINKTGEALLGFEAGNQSGDIATYTNGTFTYEQRAVAGGVFELRATADITNQSGTVQYKKGELIETQTSGEDGNAVFGAVKKLPMGTYTIIEVMAPKGQTIPDVHEWNVTLTYDNSFQGIVSESKTVNDKLANAKVSVNKIDQDTKQGLSDTYFGLYASSEIKNADDVQIVAKDQLIAVIKTDANGEGSFDVDIPYGAYYVKELQTKDGYQLSEEQYELTFSYEGQDRMASDVAIFAHTFEDERVSASISIIKKDSETGSVQGDASLAGAEYGLYAREDIVHPDGKTGVIYKAGTQITTLITEATNVNGIIYGTASVDGLYLGKYFVKEITPSEGYLLDATEYDLYALSDGINHVGTEILEKKNTDVIYANTDVYEQLIKRGFRFAKVSGGSKDTALSDLEGAGFSVYLISTLVYKADGTIDYEASPRTAVNYVGDTVAYSTYVYMVKNEEGLWTETDSSNEEAIREAAYVEVEQIPYGEYIVHETVVPENKSQAADFRVSITNEDVKTNSAGIAIENYSTPKHYSVVIDKDFEAKIKIIKIDAETGNQIALAGTVFKIFNIVTGEYVSYYDTDPNTYEKILVDCFTTNDKGILITSQTLPVGSYRIEEQLAPNGYYNSETAEGIQSEFTIDLNAGFVFEGSNVEEFYDADLNVYVLPVKYMDQQVKGSIEVSKSGEILNSYNSETGKFEYISAGLPGARYEVYSVGNIYTPDHHTDENGNRDIIYADGAYVGVIETGEDGTGSLNNLPLNENGSCYKIVEVQAPDGYLLGDTEKTAQYATLSFNGQNEKVVFDSDGVENHFNNERPSYDISIYKYERDSDGNPVYSLPLNGTTFKFVTNTDIRNFKGELIVEAGTILATNLTTDANGQARVPSEIGIPFGSYSFIETGVTPGYILDETPVNINYSYADQYTEVISVTSVKSNDYTTISIGKLDSNPAYEGILIADARMQLISENGSIIDEWTTVAGERHIIKRVPAGTYLLHEVTAPSGYVRAEDMLIVVESVKETQYFDMLDDHTKIELSKVDEDDEFVEGAVISLYKTDENGNRTDEIMVVTMPDGLNVPATFTDTTQVLRLEYVPVGTYIMHEDVTPKGYATANDVRVVVTETAKVQVIEKMVDRPITVEISKIGVTGSEEIEGAELVIYKTDDDWNIIGEVYVTPKGETCAWTSTSERHVIKYMEDGKYILHEETAPTKDGYVKVSDVKFAIVDTEIIQFVQMVDEVTKVQFSKTVKDDSSEFVVGATLSIYRVVEANGAIAAEETPIRSWVTDGKVHTETKLPVGKYVLVEEITPDGYVTADPVYFDVIETSEIQHVNMEDAEIIQPIKKTDAVTGEEIEGATLSIYHAVKNDNGEWTRDEILVINGEDVTWVSTKEEHLVYRIPAGDYILAEVTAPNEQGYVTANDIHFTVNANQAVQDTIEMKDEKSKVSISKKDITNEKELPGATLTLTDKSGNVIDSWTSTTEEHLIEGLIPGESYTLTEVAAPSGYSVAESIVFTVLDTMDVQKVTMYDKTIPDTPDTPNVPILGIEDYSTTGGVACLGLGVLSLSGAALLGKKKKRKDK